jgi:hypothetical protein
MSSCTLIHSQNTIEEMSKQFMYGTSDEPEKQIKSITETFKAAAQVSDDNRSKLSIYIEELKAKIEDLSRGNRTIRDVFGELFREKMSLINKLENDLALMKADRAKLLDMIFSSEKKKLSRTQTLVYVSLNLPSGHHTMTT